MLTRRQFLKGTAAVAGSVTGGLGASRCAPPPGTLEGIYTDRFTYRHGEQIGIHLALQDEAPVEVRIAQRDLPFGLVRATLAVQSSAAQSTAVPGIASPHFERVATVPASDLEPGLYQVAVDQSALRPENRLNRANGFPSKNHLARFAVTAAVPGSHSRILCLFDTLTGTAYGSFGDSSIYGPPGVIEHYVSWQRPGLDRNTADAHAVPRFLRQNGYALEFLDLVALDAAPPGALDAYDLVLASSQLEYVPQTVLDQLVSYVDGGGNLLVASSEFATFRVRLDAYWRQLRTFKYDFETLDPNWSSPSAAVRRTTAGVGMNIPDATYETELLGQTVWGAHQVTSGAAADLTLQNLGDAGWILDGTGLGEGDALPAAFSYFATGNLLAPDGGSTLSVTMSELSRTPPETVVWAYAPSNDARAWWEADGRHASLWPILSNGHATATLQQRASGATIVSLPNHEMLNSRLDDPLYQTLLLNLVGGLGGA